MHKNGEINNKNLEKKSFKKLQQSTKDNTKIPIYLERTIKRFGEFKGLAYDLGCGAGNESIYLIKNGWKVFAVDKETEVIKDRCNELTKQEQVNLTIAEEDFKNLNFEQDVDFILSLFSLPWCDKKTFYDVWSKIENSLKIGGRICITLFGINDEFTKLHPNMTFFSREDVSSLLENFEIEGKTGEIIEKEYDGKLVSGKLHHYHIFIIMGRKVK